MIIDIESLSDRYAREQTDGRDSMLTSLGLMREPLRRAMMTGYYLAMEHQRLSKNIADLKEELERLLAQEREVAIQSTVVRAHLQNLRDRIEQTKDLIDMAQQGQLPLDHRQEPLDL